MVNAHQIANALAWFDTNRNPPTDLMRWRKARNEFLRNQGVGGIIKEGKKSKLLPEWWSSASNFWFTNSSDEVNFVLKWGFMDN